MHDLTAFQRDALFVIAGFDNEVIEGDPYGLAIKRELDDYYPGDIHHGRLYPNLNDLVEKGLVEKEALDRRTNAYRLTDRGRRALSDRRDWERERTSDREEDLSGESNSTKGSA